MPPRRPSSRSPYAPLPGSGAAPSDGWLAPAGPALEGAGVQGVLLAVPTLTALQDAELALPPEDPAAPAVDPRQLSLFLATCH